MFQARVSPSTAWRRSKPAARQAVASPMRDREHRGGRFPMNIARLSHGPAEWRAGAFAILLLLIIPAAGCATAPSQDYRFDVVEQLVTAETRKSPSASSIFLVAKL